jgi:hypothetical protein
LHVQLLQLDPFSDLLGCSSACNSTQAHGSQKPVAGGISSSSRLPADACCDATAGKKVIDSLIIRFYDLSLLINP